MLASCCACSAESAWVNRLLLLLVLLLDPVRCCDMNMMTDLSFGRIGILYETQREKEWACVNCERATVPFFHSIKEMKKKERRKEKTTRTLIKYCTERYIPLVSNNAQTAVSPPL